MKDYIIRELLKRVDQSKLFVILYSDDILFGSTNKDELKKALRILDELLAIFNLSLDHTKTHFIRSSLDLPESIDIL